MPAAGITDPNVTQYCPRPDVRGDIHQGRSAGLCCLLLTRLLLAQHLLAHAATQSMQRSGCRQTGHSWVPIWREPKPRFRRIQLGHERRGTNRTCAGAALAYAETLRIRGAPIFAMMPFFTKAAVHRCRNTADPKLLFRRMVSDLTKRGQNRPLIFHVCSHSIALRVQRPLRCVAAL